MARATPQVVGDVETGEVLLVDLLGEEPKDQLLDGHVQGRGGLVGDDHLGLVQKGHGDQDPLAHPAAELAGILAQDGPGVRDVHLVQILQGLFPGRPFHAPAPALDRVAPQAHPAHLPDHAVDHDLADGEDRVEGGHGVLGDIAHLLLNQGPFVLVQAQDLLAGKGYPALLDDRRGNAQGPQEGLGGDALAAAGLAHQAHDLTFVHLQGDPPEDPDKTVDGLEMDGQVFYLGYHLDLTSRPLRRSRAGRRPPG